MSRLSASVMVFTMESNLVNFDPLAKTFLNRESCILRPITEAMERMKRFNITLVDIRRLLEATNIETPAGTLVNRNRVASVQAGGVLRSADDVRNVVIGLEQHRPVYLKDVATIIDGPGEIERVHRIGFGPAYSGDRPQDLELPAVTLALAKRSGTNAVTVAEEVLAELERIKDKVIPEGIRVNITRDDGARAKDAVNTLMEHLAIAVVTVVLLLVFFLGWRAASIVTITIPLILFIVLTVGYIAGQTINRITLFALILSLGLLVDDSIVVIENIFRHYTKKGVDRMQAAIRAVNEIGEPTNLATFTVILAFLPMLWVSGMMGPYMAPIPFNVPVAMLVSLIIAYCDCIGHGINMTTAMGVQKQMVACGYWPLYHYDPRDVEQPFRLDSRAPKGELKEYRMQQARFAMLSRSKPEECERLAALGQQDVRQRWKLYEHMAAMRGDGEEGTGAGNAAATGKEVK